MDPSNSGDGSVYPGDIGRRADDATLRHAFDVLQLGVTITDPSGLLTYVNPAAAATHGYEAGELIGQAAHVLGGASAHQVLTPGPLANARRWTRETVNVRKNGESFPVLLMSDVLLDAAGNPLGVVTVYEDIPERKRQAEAAAGAGLRDPLTGLVSRGFLLGVLDRVVQRRKRYPERRFAVLYLDLDRFARINDSLGHEVGDILLTGVGHRLATSVRPSDVVARIAGDEFAALLEDTRSEADGIRVAERWVAALATPFHVAGRELFLSANIGIALSDAGHEDAHQYLADASAAMQRARGQGHPPYQVFDRAVHKRSTGLLRLEMDLRQAVEHDQLRVAYQPIVDLRTEQCTGFEALVRWQRDENSLVPPGDFIPVAEQTGLILSIEAWVLRAACQQLAAWRQRFPGHGGLTISVNFSARHLRQPDVVDEVLATLGEAGLPPESLKLEITETMLMEEAETQLRAVTALRRARVGVVIDDFGTGYSSLAYLRRFRVDTLKIDRSFLGATDEGDAWAIVHMIVALARSMDIIVVAEGVERADQKGRLQELGCNFGQGFLLGRPMEASTADQFLSSRR